MKKSEIIKNDAVSAVVGVMMILTITIISAAIIAAFSVGVLSNSEPQPSVDLSVSTAGNNDSFRIMFEHLGGDILETSEIKITLFVKHPDREDTSVSFVMSDITEKTNWGAGEIISTENALNTSKILKMTPAELNEAIKMSLPLSVNIYHTPSSVLIHGSEILFERR